MSRSHELVPDPVSETPTWVAADLAPVVVEDYRSDRLILEEISAELARLHRRLDEYEPHARRLLDNPIARMLRGRTTYLGDQNGR
jgi:hypothetical protein